MELRDKGSVSVLDNKVQVTNRWTYTFSAKALSPCSVASSDQGRAQAVSFNLCCSLIQP